MTGYNKGARVFGRGITLLLNAYISHISYSNYKLKMGVIKNQIKREAQNRWHQNKTTPKTKKTKQKNKKPNLKSFTQPI